MKRSPLLSVAMAPHTHTGVSVGEVYSNQIYALLPAAVAGVWLWGLGGLRVLLLAVGATMVLEYLAARLARREHTLLDASAAAQGLMLGMLLHAASPWWLILVAALILVALGRRFFGGLGGYPMNPVLLAYAITLVSWPARLNVTQQLAGTAARVDLIPPLIGWRTFGPPGVAAYPLGKLLLGLQAGGVGSTMVLLLLLGGLYLAVRGFIAWRIPLAFLASAAATAFVFRLIDAQAFAPPLFHLFSGIAIFAAFFLATDFTTAPVNPWAQVIYGAGCGLLMIVIRSLGIYAEGTVFAILLMNLAQPLIDKIHAPVIAVEVPQR